MKTLMVRNVCHALPLGIELLQAEGERMETRNGPALVMPCPVTTLYKYPTQRVMFSSARDANPFFHLAESIWMLRGQNDADSINWFVKDFGMRYAEPNGKLHGAYGHRWRKAWEFDQLQTVINRLKSDPDDRRSVIGMWDPGSDLYEPEEYTPRDLPCNTHLYLRVKENLLHMTICCRSNDIIWGAYGANAVHFSFLLEYLAAHLGLDVGCMWQISHNYHAYISEIEKLEKRVGGHLLTYGLFDDRYKDIHPDRLQSLIDNPRTFDREITNMRYEEEPFLVDTFSPMMAAWDAWKDGEDPFPFINCIRALDWRMAAHEWMTRRLKVN